MVNVVVLGFSGSVFEVGLRLVINRRTAITSQTPLAKIEIRDKKLCMHTPPYAKALTALCIGLSVET